MIPAGYNGSQVSTMNADGLVSQHQSISSHGTDLMCSQLAMKPFMIPWMLMVWCLSTRASAVIVLT